MRSIICEFECITDRVRNQFKTRFTLTSMLSFMIEIVTKLRQIINLENSQWNQDLE
jgi:hypothetical protein